MKDLVHYTREPARQLLDVAGEDVVLTNQVVDYWDDYNDPVYEEHTLETNAEIVVRGTPGFERRIAQTDVDVTAVAWVMDDVASNYGDSYGDDYGGFKIYTGEEEEANGPTLLEGETHEFQVYEIFDEQNGKLRLHLE